MRRRLTTELLDHLDPNDPMARRSRRDLRMIDAVLGNSRWIVRALKKHHPQSIVELGAGEGRLCRRLTEEIRARVMGLDRMPPPQRMPQSVEWIQGDFMQTLATIESDTCCGSLILHHLDEGALATLGRLFGKFRHLTFSEPHRARWPLIMATMAAPLAGDVTRHDMPASICAGFRKGELETLLSLDPRAWSIRESVTPWGALRFQAIRA